MFKVKRNIHAAKAQISMRGNRQSARTSVNAVESTSAVNRGSTFHGLRKRDADVTETMPAL